MALKPAWWRPFLSRFICLFARLHAIVDPPSVARAFGIIRDEGQARQRGPSVIYSMQSEKAHDTTVFAETSRCRLLIGCDQLNAQVSDWIALIGNRYLAAAVA
jgi:hypothetical protein